MLTLSREVQDGLVEADRVIAAQFAQLRKDDFLVSVAIEDVQQLWQGVEALFDRRSKVRAGVTDGRRRAGDL